MAYEPFSTWRAFQGSEDLQSFNDELADVFIRIYALDPDNYATNEFHVKDQFEKLAASTITAAERMREMRSALDSLKIAIADLEAQQPKNYVIDEEPDTEELLS